MWVIFFALSFQDGCAFLIKDSDPVVAFAAFDTVYGSLQGEISNFVGGWTLENLPTVTLSDGTASYKTIAEKNGSFDLDQVPDGTYCIRVDALGFEPVVGRLQLNKEKGETKRIRLTLNLAT